MLAGLRGRLLNAKPGQIIYMNREEYHCFMAGAVDLVNHPPHYTSHPSGVECIQVTEHMNFNLGNAMKYIWRAGEKGDKLTDLLKAKWYLEREITLIQKNQSKT